MKLKFLICLQLALAGYSVWDLFQNYDTVWLWCLDGVAATIWASLAVSNVRKLKRGRQR